MELKSRVQKSLDLIDSLEKEGMEPLSILSFLCATHALACGMLDMKPEDFSRVSMEMSQQYPAMYEGCKTLKKALKS